MTQWTEQAGVDFATEFAAVAGCDLSVMQIGQESHWLVRQDGRDVAEGIERQAGAARKAAEAAALKAG